MYSTASRRGKQPSGERVKNLFRRLQQTSNRYSRVQRPYFSDIVLSSVVGIVHIVRNANRKNYRQQVRTIFSFGYVRTTVEGLMAKINNDQVASDIKTAFEAMKTLFNVGSSSINLNNPEGGLPGSAGGGTAMKQEFVPFCISVCGMNDLVDAIKTMKNSLLGLQASLLTLEYCLITLTVILTFAVATSALGLLWYIAKNTFSEKSKKKSAQVHNLQTAKKHFEDETEMREADT